MRIETDRLIITEFTADMAEDVHRNSLDEDNRKFVPDEVFETAEDAREALEFLISQYGRFTGPQTYAVFTKTGAENIGYVQMVPLDGSTWEIGYHITKKHTGNGYATEAVRAFLPRMAKEIGTDEVQGICLSGNEASRRVLMKCGFVPVFEGIGDYQGRKRKVFRSIWKMPGTEKSKMDTESVRIRPVTPGDYDRIYALWDSTEQSRRALNPVDDSREGIERYLKRNPTTCFLACEDDGSGKEGKTAGVILTGHDGRRAMIHHLCVHPDYRRRGIARMLVRKAEEALREEGITKVFGLVFKDNDAANAFWEEQGYSLRTNLNYRNKSLNENVPKGE